MEEFGKTEAALVAARRENLAALRSRGNDPFAQRRYEVDATAAELLERYGFLVPGQDASAEGWSLAGRLLSKRTMGKTIFADLGDRTGKLQIYLRKEEIGDEAFADWNDLDRGDLIGVRGYMFRSKMGELTLHVTRFVTLGKALMPLPDKWHGLQDVEKRYRQRYVDLIVNPDVRDTMIMRSRLIAEMRRFIDGHGFYEVETPTLLHVAGGAAARPFVTHCNALDKVMQLRIATELNLKRLIVAGLERVYEIGRIFRNEGIDTTHNPEFTMLELYAAYWDVSDMLEFNEALIAHLVSIATDGGTDLPHGDDDYFVRAPVRPHRVLRRDARDTASGNTRASGCSIRPPRRPYCEQLGLPPSPTHGHALDKIFERVARAASGRADVRHRLSGRDLAAGQAPSRRSGVRRPLRALLRQDGDLQRLHGAQRSRRSARALRGRKSPSEPAETKRFPSRIGITCARSSTACHRRRESAIGVDRLIMLLTGSALGPRRAALSAAAPARLMSRRIALALLLIVAIASGRGCGAGALLLSQSAAGRSHGVAAAAARSRLVRSCAPTKRRSRPPSPRGRRRELAEAQEASARSVFFFARSIGPGFTQRGFPLTARFFAHVSSDVQAFNRRAKAYWERPRPDGATRNTASYPSGHAAFAASSAIVLSQLIPAKRDAIFAQARDLRGEPDSLGAALSQRHRVRMDCGHAVRLRDDA